MKRIQFKIYFLIVFVFVFLFFYFLNKFPLKAEKKFNFEIQPQEILVKLKSNQKIYKIHFKDNPNLLEIQKLLLERKEIEYAEPNFLVRIAYLPNDPFYKEQWYLNKIKASQGWDFIKGGSDDVIVAVLDTGVDIDHPDLKSNIWVNKKEIPGNGIDDDKNGYIDDYYGWDFIRNIPNPKPKFDEPYEVGPIHHGTMVAGIIAAVGDNHQGIIGLAWKVKIMSLRVLNSKGTGSVEAVIRAINYAKANGANIINLSFVGSNRSEFLAEALKEAWKAGLIIVAAAGNEASGEVKDLDAHPLYPICLDADEPYNYIIGVGATNQFDQKAHFSNFGSKCIDLVAPGSGIYGLLTHNSSLPEFKEYYGGYWSGTSLATPLVSATAALVKSLNPTLNNEKVRDFILNNTDNIEEENPNFKGKLGKGRLNVYKVLDSVYKEMAQKVEFRYIVTGALEGGGPHIRILKSSGFPVNGFFAYSPKFSGGVKVAVGDVDGDGEEEIITAPASNGGAHVRIFDIKGNLKSQFFALKNYYGGLNLAVCNLNKDQNEEIIISPTGKIEPKVLIFDWQGNLLEQFLVKEKNYRNEVKVACGDVDGDSENEILVSFGKNTEPIVKIFNSRGELEVEWLAFSQKFTGGVNLSVGDLDNDNVSEIVVSVASGANPYVRIFNYFGLLKVQFKGYETGYFNGVNLTVADLDGDNKGEIIVSTGKGVPPTVQIFDSMGRNLGAFFAYNKKFLGGVSVATIKAK
jgi:hypothetical protein